MMLLALLACEPPEPAVPCEPDPDITWSSFGAGFIAGRCQGCHGSGAPDRHGAPASLVFDTEADVVAQASAVRRTVVDDATMPPGGGLTDIEQVRLAAWLSCP